MFEWLFEKCGYISKKEMNIIIRRLERQISEQRKRSYNNGYDDAKNGKPHKYDLSQSLKTELIILFIKADRSLSFLNLLRNEGNFSTIDPDGLVENTNRIWVGSKRLYEQSGLPSLFSRKSECSSVGEEYDLIALKVEYPKGVEYIYKNSDPFVIGQVIRKICDQSLKCEAISERLPFMEVEKFDLIKF